MSIKLTVLNSHNEGLARKTHEIEGGPEKNQNWARKMLEMQEWDRKTPGVKEEAD